MTDPDSTIPADPRGAAPRTFHLNLPAPALIALVGVSGAGKSSFAARHFRPTEVVSSDHCRGLVCDDPNEQGVNAEAFAVVHAIVRARLALGKLVVVDATHVQPEARAPLVELARAADLFAVAVVLDIPMRTCEDRNAARPDRQFGPHVVRNQHVSLRRSLRGLKQEGFKQVWVLRPDQIAHAEVHRVPLWTDRRHETGPFDIIGDVHGCGAELRALLTQLGYVPADPLDPESLPVHPEGRRLIFLGDLVDRGPDSVGVVNLVRRLIAEQRAFCVAGNHDEKFLKYLRGKEVRVAHGLGQTLAQVEALPTEVRQRFEAESRAFLDGLVSHYVLDGGKLVVAHAGMKQEYQGRSSARVRSYALYGDTTGEVDSGGLPVRRRWAEDYRGPALVVYGHTPVRTPERLNNTINIDTGCCFGGALTALRYPEGDLVAIPAATTYAEPARPFLDDPVPPMADSAEPEADPAHRAGVAGLRLEDVAGPRVVTTRLMGRLKIRAEQTAPALEMLSRFAVDPRWLIYLPPTMAPCASSPSGPFLEHPTAAFDQYRSEGVGTVVCQTKHMGSRAVVVVVREPEVAVSRFGFDQPALGMMVTRTGRRFFQDEAVEAALLGRVAAALEQADLWNELDADWVALDAELLPWNAKAATLVRDQYAPVGASGQADLAATAAALRLAAGRGVPLGDLIARTDARLAEVAGYVAAYRPYCWPTEGLNGLKLAPFHLLAAGSSAFLDRDHAWHLDRLDRLAAADPALFEPTPRRVVDLLDPAAVSEAVAWWVERTDAGMEGMVVKPADFVVHGPRGLLQPAIKVRGAIISGSSTVLNTSCPRTSTASAPEVWAGSERWPSASSPWGPRRWSASPGASRCTASTNASRASSPLKPRRLMRGSDALLRLPRGRLGCPGSRIASKKTLVSRLEGETRRMCPLDLT